MPDQFSMTWDLTSYFPAFDGPEYLSHRDGLKARLEGLLAEAEAIGALNRDSAPRWRDFLLRHEEIYRDYSHISSYIGCLCSAEAKNEDYKREQARLSQMGALYRKALVPFTAALRTAGNDEFEALALQSGLEDVRYYLERSRQDAQYSMEPALEMLTADLSVDGISAWGRLYNTIAGTLEFDLKKPDGTIERVSFAQKNTLLDDPDPAIRKSALEDSNKAWEQHADTVAACLNGIAGTRLTLNKRRGVNHFLDVAMFQSAVSTETIEQMWAVVAANRDVPRKFLRAKAKALGVEKLGFQDLTAPIPTASEQRYTWQEGTAIVLDAFGNQYGAFRDFARMMMSRRWIESEKRAGKRPGGFCTSSQKTGESRIFMTYGGSIDDVRTLAHELGHAWHNAVMRDMRPLAHLYPMTLAETASTFAESILTTALMRSESVDPHAKMRLLHMQLDHSAVYLLNIHMRYMFEKQFYTERAGGEVSVPRLKELMLEAQRECYGDILREEEMDPWFWASKLHFYITGITFYNFPYTFGFLFSLGLAARFAAEGVAFLPRYEELLRLTGSDTAENVAMRSIGVDLRQPGFWQETLDSIRREVDQFDALVSSQ